MRLAIERIRALNPQCPTKWEEPRVQAPPVQLLPTLPVVRTAAVDVPLCVYKRQFSPRDVEAIYAKDARNERAYLQAKAHRFVTLAVLEGYLPDLRRTAIRCADCANQATDWDHRDYCKPLDVDPVCRSCNMHRGPAAELPART
jgi:hypothetical protein